MEPMDTSSTSDRSEQGVSPKAALIINTSNHTVSSENQLAVNVIEDCSSASEKPVSHSTLFSNNGSPSLNLINSNVLPPFRAKLPMAPWLKVVIPAGGYKCLDCGDTFLLEASLKQHLERRSIYIHFACDVCKLSLIYYNRCSLLAHARNHKTKNETVDLSKAVVSPLSKELLISNLVSPVVYPGVNGGTTCSALLSHLSRESSNEVSASHIKGGKYRCPECFQHFESADGREEHFSSGQSNPATLSQCAKCTMLCPSKCSLQAHQRIHLKILPYVCPECGEQCLNSWEEFIFHLENQCYHFARSIAYNCTICDGRHLSSSALQKHILKSHTKAYVKCQACPMAFKGPSAFEYHTQVAHSGVGNHSKYIFKCPLCDTVFHGKEQLLNHLSVHITEQLNHTQYVFCCTECSAVHNSKYILIAHTETMHPKARSISQSFENSLGLKNMTVMQTIPDNVQNDTDTNKQTSVDNRINNSSIDFASNHKELYKTFKCKLCSVQFMNRNLLIAHEKKHLRDGVLLCMLCHVTDFKEASELEQHLKDHISDIFFPAKCYHCDYVLADQDVALFHFSCEHLLRTETQAPNKSNKDTKKVRCPYCDKPLSRKSLLRMHITRYHKNEPMPENIDSDETNLPPIKIRIPLQLVRSEAPTVSTPSSETSNAGENDLKNDAPSSPTSDNLNIIIENVVSVASVSANEKDNNDKAENTNSERIDLPIEKSTNSINETISEVVEKYKLNGMLDDTMGESSTGNPPELPTAPSLIQKNTPKKLRNYNSTESNYVCAKCDYNCLEVEEFRQHILLHRKDESSLQCPECGICFVVEPTLRKHLVIAHKVPNVEQYMENIKAYLEESPTKMICQTSNNQWQCRVCCATFENESTLKFHLRSHGMAFIRSKVLFKS